MPIRTHRGRAAVYRRLWGWPLRSPKHLIAAVIGLAVVVGSVGLLLPEPSPSRAHGQQHHAQEPFATSEFGASADTSGSPPTISVPRASPSSVPPDPAGLAVVDAWGRQWVKHPPGTDSGEWLDRLRPYTTAEFITVMASIDPANVAATEVTGSPEATTSTATAMKVRLPTDAGAIRVRVTATPDGWRVAGYEKAA
ncbi:hypothetical protein DFQ14_11016 [Halopolyspora algeriensis]|uniref:Uncharacterized protein n=1 Tax=Halopolyspora algeriensis TaxID=1500506 RepID=A0A368VJK9_9ACTN|nr:hypothetical protein [Halopolyspora algeriensis]RCW40692.1 hypothetical protein DFQ14_11016 [Halopolyspora algeriensis]TQM53385.1 hypothetical protein FHU43_2782 [Halopolyspora algeriensis]